MLHRGPDLSPIVRCCRDCAGHYVIAGTPPTTSSSPPCATGCDGLQASRDRHGSGSICRDSEVDRRQVIPASIRAAASLDTTVGPLLGASFATGPVRYNPGRQRNGRATTSRRLDVPCLLRYCSRPARIDSARCRCSRHPSPARCRNVTLGARFYGSLQATLTALGKDEAPAAQRGIPPSCPSASPSRLMDEVEGTELEHYKCWSLHDNARYRYTDDDGIAHIAAGVLLQTRGHGGNAPGSDASAPSCARTTGLLLVPIGHERFLGCVWRNGDEASPPSRFALFACPSIRWTS